MSEEVWFIGPWERPGFYLRVSTAPGRSDRPGRDEQRGSEQYHQPPNFPWDTMDRTGHSDTWAACRQPQGTTGVDYLAEWSVLSVADYTVDRRPNVLVAFAVERPDVPEAELRALAEERYPSVWQRLGVRA